MKKFLSIIGLIVLGGAMLLGGVMGVAMIAGIGLSVWAKIDSLIRIIASVGSVVVVYLAFTTVKTIIKGFTKKINESEIRSIVDWRWLAVCIALLILIPISKCIDIVHSPIPLGDYIVDAKYTLRGNKEYYDSQTKEYVYDEIEASGTTPIKINIDRDIEYEDYETFAGGYERTATRTVVTDIVNVDSIFLADSKSGDYVEYYLDETDVNTTDKRDIELLRNDGYYVYVNYTIGEITEERLGYTLEDKIAGFSTASRILFVAIMLCDIVSIAGYFYVLLTDKKQQFKQVS